ncbi:hypothetical protein ZQ34_005139 [Salmonella enterica subsp. salamae]|nr:hypothetical protein [Salmonella enterica subsp. salamae]EED7442394.1 hypothetical protein [Salmonella enterica subsp. salamae]EEI9684408.1 hypothetical protein [Salmonella enterica]EKN4993115.1 hypothetical protein [Salmonella enterica]EKT4207229.1 hypothetical protein [Salmonella enterica]
MKVMNEELLSMVCGAGGIFGGIGGLNTGIGSVAGAATDTNYDHLGHPVYGSAGVKFFCKSVAIGNSNSGSPTAWKEDAKGLYNECMANPKEWGYKH